jgi:hypothetical protein
MSPHPLSNIRWRAAVPAAVAVCALAAPLATAQAASATPHEALFTTWARNVPIRLGAPGACGGHPSTAACPTVAGRAEPGDELLVHCLRTGQPVDGDQNWASVVDHTNNSAGWMPAHYVRTLSVPLAHVGACPR